MSPALALLDVLWAFSLACARWGHAAPLDATFATGALSTEAAHAPSLTSLVSTGLDDLWRIVVDLLGLEREYAREEWEEDYLYGVSLVGGLWLTIRVLLHWRVDLDAYRVVPREDVPVSLARVLSRLTPSGDDDADHRVTDGTEAADEQ